jgi:multimeric flavodoxin WrbA
VSNLGVAGSNRRDGSSYLLLKEMFRDVPSVEMKIVQLAELSIKPCELCFDQCVPEPSAVRLKMILRGFFGRWGLPTPW